MKKLPRIIIGFTLNTNLYNLNFSFCQPKIFTLFFQRECLFLDLVVKVSILYTPANNMTNKLQVVPKQTLVELLKRGVNAGIYLIPHLFLHYRKLEW